MLAVKNLRKTTTLRVGFFIVKNARFQALSYWHGLSLFSAHMLLGSAGGQRAAGLGYLEDGIPFSKWLVTPGRGV